MNIFMHSPFRETGEGFFHGFFRKETRELAFSPSFLGIPHFSFINR